MKSGLAHVHSVTTLKGCGYTDDKIDDSKSLRPRGGIARQSDEAKDNWVILVLLLKLTSLPTFRPGPYPDSPSLTVGYVK